MTSTSGGGSSYRTTHVGSLPRPPDLSPSNLEEAVEAVVRMQLEAGVEEVNDGEYRRSIFFGDIAGLPGFRHGALDITASAGDSVAIGVVEKTVQYDPKKPVISEEVRGIRRALKRLGEKGFQGARVKVTIPSLSWMSIFYPDERTCPTSDLAFLERAREAVKPYYPTLDDYLDDVKAILANEVGAALSEGADSVQLDAPDLLQFDVYGQYHPSHERERLRFAVSLDNELLSQVEAGAVQVHSCFGNLRNTQFNTLGHYGDALPELYELKAGVIGPLEVFDGIRDFSELKYFKEYGMPDEGAFGSGRSKRRLALGLVSVKTRNVEPVEAIRERYKAALDALGASEGDLIVAPGCGFASDPVSIHTIESARRKLTNMAKAVLGR